MREYFLMCKNKPILTFEMDASDGRIYKILEVIDLDFAPLGIKDFKGNTNKALLANWWESRVIPSSRSGFSRALMDLGIEKSTILLVKCHGLSLNDQFWIKESNSDLDWEKINFFDNDFSEDIGRILFGEKIENPNLLSPDNSSDGWLKKKWKIINGDRVLLKSGSGESLQEPINEALVSKINERTGYKNYTTYWIIWDDDCKPLSACKNFINRDTEFISAWYLSKSIKKSNSVSDYQHYLNCCDSVGIDKEETIEFMKYQTTLDYLVLNQDRHYNNFGIIKDVNQQAILGHAPIFDTGTSLWNGIATPFIGSDKYEDSRPFRKTHTEQLKLIGRSEWFTKDSLYGISDEFNVLLKQSPFISVDRRDKLVKSLDERINNFFNLKEMKLF